MNARRDYLSVALAFTVLTLGLLLCFMPLGCARESNLEAQPWQSEWDADWAAVTRCWGVTPPKPGIVIRKDCVMSKTEHILVFPSWASKTGYASGECDGKEITLCPDERALRHELSEYVKRFAPGGMSYTNGSGKCFL